MASLPFNLGALQIGFSISTLLFGFTTVQFYYYLRHFPEDSRYLKSLAYTVWLAEVGHQICLSHIGHWFLVINHGNTRVLDGPQPLSIAFSVFFVAVISFLVQAFFAFRLWKVTKRTALVYVLVCFVVARLLLSIAIGVIQCRSPSISAFQKFKPLVIPTWVCSAIGDLLTTFLLSHDLHTRRSGIYSTSKLIDRAIITVVATGMLTSICAISITICYLTMENLVWTAIFMVIPRFFSNSMLTSLNSRLSLRRMDATMRSHFYIRETQGDDGIELRPVIGATDTL